MGDRPGFGQDQGPLPGRGRDEGTGAGQGSAGAAQAASGDEAQGEDPMKAWVRAGRSLLGAAIRGGPIAFRGSG